MIDHIRVVDPRRPVRWDIQVNPDVTENSLEYNHAKGVVIRAKSIDIATIYVLRARELIEKYPDNTPDPPRGFSEGG